MPARFTSLNQWIFDVLEHGHFSWFLISEPNISTCMSSQIFRHCFSTLCRTSAYFIYSGRACVYDRNRKHRD
ncbi:unnamed protein product [Haemonchus placei]|uniref:Secreted protein n=1 Tax=Haemonchus placei TaxID=6290 RepID=A0A0N4WYE4_HAEPC|nr:unnamed protein product [Haemonchus placei]